MDAEGNKLPDGTKVTYEIKAFGWMTAMTRWTIPSLSR